MIVRRAATTLRKLIKRRTRVVTSGELPDATKEDLQIIQAVAPYTMTSPERCFALIEAVRYAVKADVEGDFAECGVWRGGSVLGMLMTLQQLGVSDRNIWLYDTFEGMTAPSERDRSKFTPPALETWNSAASRQQRPWSVFFDPETFGLEQVKQLLYATGYPAERLHFVQGPVEQTLPSQAPDQIALLRLDTDWYESTHHELKHLYPKLTSGGVLIIDDYGHWQGCREAVDEYFDAPGTAPVLLNRVDYACRMVVKR